MVFPALPYKMEAVSSPLGQWKESQVGITFTHSPPFQSRDGFQEARLFVSLVSSLLVITDKGVSSLVSTTCRMFYSATPAF